jgi:hypothetical protein
MLPAMTLAEALKTARIHCVAGLTGDHTAFVMRRKDHLRGGHKKAGSELGWNPARPSRMQGQHPTTITQVPALGLSSQATPCRLSGVMDDHMWRKLE